MHRRLFPRAVALLALAVTAATVGASGATAESPTPATTRLRATIDTSPAPTATCWRSPSC
ncbi:hypothetical protein [Micromonospora sp. NBC_00617]|uniref:hypothetical protein n=1 Tax=Micromonospora sp. NBC_00617 TaxID=2903587 RepID=UPI0030E0EDB9